MQVNFGKHRGKSVELLMLKQPDYIKWLLDQNAATGAMAAVRTYILQLITIFDAKPFVDKSCWASDCNNDATRFSVYFDNLKPFWWCDTCDPYQVGAPHGNLQLPVGYRRAIEHVAFHCRGRSSDYKEIIKMITQGKGCPLRVGEVQAMKFFS